MIFTVRPVQMTLLTSKIPLQDFMDHHLIDQGRENYKRENYFIRYIGFDEDENKYLSRLEEIDQKLRVKEGYLCIDGLLRYFPTSRTNKYIEMYEQWLQKRNATHKELLGLSFPTTFQNEMMALSQRVAFEKVMTLYEQKNPVVNASIKKNFAVTLLGLSDHFLPLIFGKCELHYGKVIYIGEIKKQELYFLYYLNLLGCDILYVNPEKDIKEKYPECEGFSSLYEGTSKKNIDVMKYIQKITTNHDQQNAPVQNRQEQAESMQQPKKSEPKAEEHGSINLGHAHTASVANTQRGSIQIRQSGSTQSQAVNRTSTSNAQTVQSSQSAYVPSRHENVQPVRPVGGLERPHVKRTYDRELSYEELAKLSTSVVMIGIADENGEVHGSGSGVVINHNGYILTNYHVVSHGVRYFVKFENETDTYETRRIVKYHPELDLAIIKVEKNCRPLEVYSGSQIVRGQKVVAIGSPLGLFNSISDGIVSAFRTMEDGNTMIQFTAPISHGSSGGAVLDLYGRVIGISTGGYDDGQNLNLAVSSESIRFFAGNYINQY